LFFIELGAFNGITHSNTLWLELEHHWHGLLVEANPSLVELVQRSGRSRSHLVNGCLSLIKDTITRVDFSLAGPLGGIVTEMDDQRKERISREVNAGEKWVDKSNEGATTEVTCYPHNAMLKALNVSTVDFWSLDTEGSEISILKTVDFDAVIMFGLVFIEANNAKHLKQMTELMKSLGFVENVSLTGNQDSAWQNPAYCKKYNCAL
jgi:hypothetical protein